MIEIICDQYGLHPFEDKDCIIEEDFQYEEGLNRIRKHAQSGEPLRIVVKNPALFHWFDSAAKKFGCQIKKIDPLAELSNTLQFSVLPKVIMNNPKWVVELCLQDKAVEKPILENESADRWLKRILLGEIWQLETLSSTKDFAELFSWLITQKEVSLHPLAKYLLQEQLQIWITNCPEKAEFFEWLKIAPFSRAQFVAWEQALSRYSESQIAEWLQHDDIWYNLSLLPDRKKYIPALNLQVQVPENIAGFVRGFLDEQWKTSPAKALSYISGQLDVEKIALFEQLRYQLHNGIPIEQSVFDSIVHLKNFPEVIELALRLVPAQEPSNLSENTDVPAIQSWLRDEYLPFYSSCAILNKLDLTNPYVEQFEYWLRLNYAGLLINGEGMAYRQIFHLKEKLLDEPVLLVVFDGLDYLTAQKELLPAMQRLGFYPKEELFPYLAFLPSETFIAKPTIVCGRMNSQIPPENPCASFYRKLLQDSFGFAEEDIRSATDNELSIQELVQKPAKAYLYLDNQLDREFLHSGLSPYIRRKKYADYVKKQATAIAESAELAKDLYGATLLISVSSDHGYTVIPRNAPIISVPSSAKKAKIRSLYTDEVDLPENFDRKQVWLLKPDMFGLNREMAIPCGYSCFAKRPKGAIHGGCTPQEMAVPWFIMSSQKPETFHPLVFAIKGEIFRKRKDNSLTINISNPNNYPVSIVKCDIKGIDISSRIPLRIHKRSIDKIVTTFNASGITDNIIDFQGCYLAQSETGETQEKFSLKVHTTGAMSNEFEDDFEF
ncbi:MAG: hypothetical protein KAS66_12355 [Candidatus Omnitrophica bacterium]|nr:hypothetical protein [Candidatus Omnitrophota bacterium]